MTDVRLIDANELKEKRTCLWDSALGHCACVLIEDVDSAPTINPEDFIPQWISVEDRLPEPMEWVLCFCQGNIIEVLRYDHIMDDWDRAMPNRCYMRGFVTHWMPLPEPPKNEEYIEYLKRREEQEDD